MTSEALSWGVSPETLLDVPTATIPLSVQKFGIAADPSGFLVTWIDERALIESTHVSNAGVLSNSYGTMLFNGSTSQVQNPYTDDPAVQSAFNGQYYLVAWSKYGASATTTEIVAVRVSPSGEPLDSTPIVIATSPLDSSNTRPPHIDTALSDGNEFFIAWQGILPDNPGVQSRTVSFSGSTPALSPVYTFDFSSLEQHFFVFDGSKYAVAYIHNPSFGSVPSFHFKRFSGASPGTDPGVVYQVTPCPNTGAALMALSSNGNGECLVVYAGSGPTSCAPTYSALQIGSDLQPKFPVVPLNLSGPYPVPAGYMGGKYYAGGLQIDSVTNSASPAPFMAWSPLACNATTCLMPGGDSNLARFSAQGVPLDPATINPANAAPAESDPLVAAGAGEYLVVWTEAGATVYAGRVSAAGASLDPTPLSISSAPTGGTVWGVTFNGTDFLVLWQQDRTLRVTRVSPLGVVKAPIDVVTTETYIAGTAFACASNDCLVVWSSPGAGVLGTRLTADGTMSDSPPIQVLMPPATTPRMLAPSGSGYVLQYGDATGGTVRLDATGHAIGSVMPGNAEILRPCGSNFLLFKFVQESGAYSATLVDLSGTVLVDNVDLGGTVKNQYSVASSATGCTVTWGQTGPTSDDIYANSIRSDGSGATPQAMPIATDTFNEIAPALALAGDRMLIAYSHLVPSAPYGNYRIGARVVTLSEGGSGTGGVGGVGGVGGGSSSGAGSSSIGGSPAGSGGTGPGPTAGQGGAAGLTADAGFGGLPSTGGTGGGSGGSAGTGGVDAEGGAAFGGAAAVGGATDAGTAGASTVDMGTADAGTADAGTADAGTAGTTDAGTHDAAGGGKGGAGAAAPSAGLGNVSSGHDGHHGCAFAPREATPDVNALALLAVGLGGYRLRRRSRASNRPS
ncbi:MAG: hypothetical protein WDO69_15360 [Pseudomonadota bacterium]